MCESPLALQKICLDFLSCNIKSVFTETKDVNRNTVKYVFKNPQVFFHQDISEKLLDALEDKEILSDQLLTIFDPEVTRLQRVRIRNASKISSKGLRILRQHKLSELIVIGLCNITVNDLIGCLGEWTLEKLKVLNVSGSTFVNSEKVRVVVALSKLRNLRFLDVSYTEFNSRGLEIVAEDLPFLESLDISGTMIKDISPLKKCKHRLKYLNMYNLKISQCRNFVAIMCELQNLCHLDISDDKDVAAFDIGQAVCSNVTDFLKNASCLPNLVSLDISGIDNVDIAEVKLFLSCHENMQFLGLMQLELCYDDMFTEESHPMYRPNLKISGYGSEEQVLESLRRYMRRRFYVQKTLFYLYSFIRSPSHARLDIIELVLEAMKTYPNLIQIHIAATACLYYLTKGSASTKIHPVWLKKIVNSTLMSMEQFPQHLQLQKNTLLTLCSDRMLQDVSFDRYKCAELVMISLVNFSDAAMNRMSVAICSILAAKISTTETSNLGAKTSFMKRLLEIVESKTEQGEIDILMKFTLSALWNLTDESPRTCHVFLDMGGIQLFVQVLIRFSGEISVETKVLGLLNNIAEVADLRKHLMKDDFIKLLRLLLHSSLIDVSYFSAGILAHMASEGEDFWSCQAFSWKEILGELGDVVSSWKEPESEMVAYRSFQPFYPLFYCFQAYQVQLWAAWAIHHVCSKDPKRYCKMLLEEGGHHILENLLPDLHSAVAKVAQRILAILSL